MNLKKEDLDLIRFSDALYHVCPHNTLQAGKEMVSSFLPEKACNTKTRRSEIMQNVHVGTHFSFIKQEWWPTP